MYDQLSRLTKIKDSSGNAIAQYGFDALSRRTLLTYANDANAVYEYDLANRLTKLSNHLDDTNSIVFEYTDYDKVGNRRNMIVDGNTHTYTYDKLYQLTHVDYPPSWNIADANYHYDKLGSRTSLSNGSTTTYNRNSLNQYTSVGGVTYSYDNNGNLFYDGVYQYYYDCENRLTDVNAVGNVRIAHYTYDYLGRRVAKTTYIGGTVTTKFCYDGSRIIAEYSSTGTLIKKYIYGPGIDEPVCMIDVANGNAKYYYHFDGLGSVVALTDSSGAIIEKYRYDVFGNTTILSPSNESRAASLYGNRYMFTGREYDSETGNYHYRARYYKPEIGRFLQTDPIGYGDGLNWYAYCGNDPVNWVDPSGLESDPLLERIMNGDGGSIRGWEAVQGMYEPAPPPTSGEIHEGLNNTAYIPFASTWADALNAAQYFREGNKKGAALYAAGVALPFVSGPMLRTAEVRFAHSFDALKRMIGSAGEGNVWHHIVEKRAANVERFGAEAIHNTTNVVSVSHQVNQEIANYYSTVRPFTNGQTVRQWLGSQSWREQFEFGQTILNKAVTGQPLP